MIRTAVEHAAKRIPIIAGAGGNSTAEAIELTKQAKAVGADATLQVVPYYNKPTQEGMYRTSAIAEAVDLPVILYNVPGRTVADMAHETTLRLAQVPGIIGIKEATGNIDRAAHLIKAAPKDFAIYSGDDPTAIALMLLGGHGNISVTANVAPRAMSDLCRAALAGDVATARTLHMKLLSLHKNLFIEANPIPVKWALQAMGKMQGGIRLPLTPLDERCHDAVRSASSRPASSPDARAAASCGRRLDPHQPAPAGSVRRRS
jgi:4-hydroxy-tetrahydrodipicolinate synthase